MIVNENGESTSDSARLTIALPVFEIEILDSTEAWENECSLVEDNLWFDEYCRAMRENVARGTTF